MIEQWAWYLISFLAGYIVACIVQAFKINRIVDYNAKRFMAKAPDPLEEDMLKVANAAFKSGKTTQGYWKDDAFVIETIEDKKDD